VDHGLVDAARQRKPSYEVWKKLNRPATVEARWSGQAQSGQAQSGQMPTGFVLAVTPHTDRDLPSYPLHDYRLVWRIVDQRGGAVTSGERPLTVLNGSVSITGELPITRPTAIRAAGPAAPPDPAAPSDPFAHGTPSPTAAATPPDPQAPLLRLNVTLLSPTGLAAAEDMLEWPATPQVGR
jgi:beta-glucuronidase